MNKIILDIEAINNTDEMHQHLKALFDFPFYYGKNLDALYDCLTDIAEPTTVILPSDEAIYRKLGMHGRLILKVFADASTDNSNLMLSKPIIKK